MKDGLMRIAATFFHSAITHEAASSFKDRLQTLLNRPREIRPAIVHVSISTAGGHIDCGIELYNFITNKSRTCKIHTHNVGNVDSTGIIVFLAGVKRYAAPTSTFEFHTARYYINNEAFDKRQLREMCDMLENYDSLTRNIIQENTSLDENRITEFMEASRVINSQEALEFGIIHEIR